MKIAARIGIDVASVNLAKAEDQAYLLVERYDRVRVSMREPGAQKIERIHQEDFCQALAIPSSRKYQEDGGPKLVDCFALLDKTAVPAKERLKLLTAVIFNFLTGNMDAHGKNFSLLHHSSGIRLAPLYDVLCTSAFPDYSANMAMDIGDYFEPANINAHEWRTFCEDIQYSFPAFKKEAKRLCAAIPEAGRREYMMMQAAGWSHPSCERALDIMRANCEEMQERLQL
jgi:serine/threonine-protein kinase HipA